MHTRQRVKNDNVAIGMTFMLKGYKDHIFIT